MVQLVRFHERHTFLEDILMAEKIVWSQKAQEIVETSTRVLSMK